ncbi:HPP family-domain-containing protein [Lasiosphaeria ovina]|uniref:HPP family-domain-containing protein n=1 Tax=Lasiosphaeria ovina TaxID=92902 RepID=A0AAE0NFK1_9PEZI|nr:HPP family-domain-containing protein [Lasiosphaeria ovina]
MPLLRLTQLSQWNVDVDRVLGPMVPASVLPHLPSALGHFLGHRDPAGPAHRKLGNVTMVFWAAVGVFSSLAIIGAVAQHIPAFQRRQVPTIIGSLGAAAVLDFYAIESPLAQPRNAVLGQLVSSVIGVGIAKLFALSAHFEAVRWLGAALACAVATAAMGLTGTVHPPAGATALLAVLSDDFFDLGWFLLAPLMLGCALMLAVALVVNNIQRRFPVYWWSPEETGGFWRRGREKGKSDGSGGSSNEGDSRRDLAGAGAGASAVSRLGDLELSVTEKNPDGRRVVISRDLVQVPDDMDLTREEMLFLEVISQQL